MLTNLVGAEVEMKFLILNLLLLLYVFQTAADESGVEVIKQGSFRLTPANAMIDLGGFAPCRAIVIYNHELKQAVAGHLDESETTQLRQMIKKAREELGPASKWLVYISGASRILGENNRVPTIRRFLHSGVPISNLYIRWLPDLQSATMQFNSRTGVAYLSIGSGSGNSETRSFESVKYRSSDYTSVCRNLLSTLGLARLIRPKSADFEIVGF